MNEVHYSPRAAREFAEIIAYVSSQDPATAKAMATAIRAAIGRLAVDPRIAVATSTASVRRYPVRHFGITVYVRHRPRKNVLEIVRVLRGKRVRSLATMP